MYFALINQPKRYNKQRAKINMLLYFHMDYPKSTLFIDNSSISYHELTFYEIARNHICETVIPFNTVQWLHKLHYGIKKGVDGPFGDSFGLCGSQKS